MTRPHLGRAGQAVSAVAISFSSSSVLAQPTQLGGTPNPPSPGSSPVTMLIIVAVVGVIVVLHRRRVDGEQLKQKQSAQKSMACRETALDAFEQNLAATYPHVFWSSARDSAMCMDPDGQSLRFLQIGIGVDDATTIVENDLTVLVAHIVSVDLLNHHERYTESRKVERKKGAIGRAVAGELLFGGVGAIVGSTSAGSTSQTVGKEHAAYVSSELVFGIYDLQNPVVRFFSTDPIESDRWLHRVRAAMARRRAEPPQQMIKSAETPAGP